jgi:hypothetical protein
MNEEEQAIYWREVELLQKETTTSLVYKLQIDDIFFKA